MLLSCGTPEEVASGGHEITMGGEDPRFFLWYRFRLRVLPVLLSAVASGTVRLEGLEGGEDNGEENGDEAVD